MSEELAEIIREEIRQKGPIPFSRWMELCLYHPQYGYYMKPGKKTGYGPDADFVTPPTLHPFFGRAVGKEIASAWLARGRPPTFTVVEYGGGEGHLAEAALQWIELAEPRLAATLTWGHRETSPTHAAAQRQRCRGPRFRWLQPATVVPGDFIVACEFYDALPFDLFQRGAAGWSEVSVAVNDGMFEESLGRAPDPEPLPPMREGDRFPRVNDRYYLDQALSDMAPGAALLVIDYGVRGQGRFPQARAFQGHRPVPLVADNPGEYDITADVSFDEIAQFMAGSGDGPRESRFESLESFLLRHGILDELNSIDRNTPEGASSYLRLRQLLLPTGMGAAFKVQRFDRVAPLPTDTNH